MLGCRAGFEGLLELGVEADGDDACGGGAQRLASAFAAQGDGVVAGLGLVGEALDLLVGDGLASRDQLSVLHGFRDLVDPRVDRGDGLLERDVHVRAGPCAREVGPPVLMGGQLRTAMCVRSV